MENHQIFFPCSSTGQSVYTSNSDHHAFTIGDHSSSSVFWGLKTQDFVPKLTDVRQLSPSGGFPKRSENEEKLGKNKGVKVKNPRLAFQTRSHVDILDDGYRWRKYGQKAVKNNKYPRSYYRCTHQGCNVKKQIQRLTKDEGIVVTTYEGMHTHLIEKPTDNFEHILNQMQIYTPF